MLDVDVYSPMSAETRPSRRVTRAASGVDKSVRNYNEESGDDDVQIIETPRSRKRASTVSQASPVPSR